MSYNKYQIRLKGHRLARDKRRAFTQTQKNEILHQQDNKCAKCHKKLDPRAIEFDHVKGWAAQGRTVIQNGAALCPTCHTLKTHNDRLTNIEKGNVTSLKELSMKQLKYLAEKHGIKIRAKVISDLWESKKINPTKKQYLAKLTNVVTAQDLRSIPAEPVGKKKKKKKEPKLTWW